MRKLILSAALIYILNFKSVEYKLRFWGWEWGLCDWITLTENSGCVGIVRQFRQSWDFCLTWFFVLFCFVCFVFLSNLYTQHGAQSHDPEITSCTFFWLPLVFVCINSFVELKFCFLTGPSWLLRAGPLCTN